MRGDSRLGSGRPPGRPKGSKDVVPRKRRPLPEELRLGPVREALRQLYETQGLSRFLEFLDSPNERVRFEAFKLLSIYNLGQPSEGTLKPEVETIESILRQIDARRRAALPAAPTDVLDTPVVGDTAGPSETATASGEAANGDGDAEADPTQGFFEEGKPNGR